MNKRILLSPVLIFAFFASFCAIAFAQDLFPAPSIIGSTGIVRMPTADVLPYRNFNIGLDYGVNVLTNKNTMVYKMNLGTFQGLELGITGGTMPGDGMLREGVFIDMKYSLSTGNYDNPLFLAIGVENLSSYHQTDVYMVVTRYLKEGPKVHFGFMGDFPGDKFRPLGMFGMDVPLFDRLLFMFDMFAGETIFQFDTGIRYYVSPTFAITVSGINVAYNENDTQPYKDPKSYMIGFAWTNPF